MNVLYLHQHFATRAGAGGTRSYEFAKHLIAQGHTVTMITAQRQGGGIESAHRQIVDGIEVISVGGFYSNRLSRLRRLIEFARYTLRASRVRDLPHRPDVVIASSTPLTVGIPGKRLAKRYNAPFVFEVRDLWPQALIELGAVKNPLMIWYLRRLEKQLYRKADHVIALSPGMEAGVLARGITRDNVSCISNASDTDLFNPAFRDRSLLAQWGVEAKFVVIHAGSMGAANGLEYVVHGAHELHKRGIDDVHILIAGDGGTRPRLETLSRELGLSNITFTGSIQREKLGAVVSSCDVAITSFANLPILATNSPNKLFDGLAAGIPNIVNCNGWTKDLIEQHAAGMYVDATRPETLADAIVRYRDDTIVCQRHGKNARSAAENEFSRGKLAKEFETVLLEAARKDASSEVISHKPANEDLEPATSSSKR